MQGEILAPCFRNRYSCIIIMQYQSLHKFTLNSITERDNVMECFCRRRTVDGVRSIFVKVQAFCHVYYIIYLKIAGLQETNLTCISTMRIMPILSIVIGNIPRCIISMIFGIIRWFTMNNACCYLLYIL